MVADIPSSTVILGVPWLKSVVVSIDWAAETIKFQCLAQQTTTTLQGCSAESCDVAEERLESRVSVVSYHTFSARGQFGRATKFWKVARINEILGPEASIRVVTPLKPADQQLKDQLIAHFPKLFAEPVRLPPARPEDMEIKVGPNKPKPRQRGIGKLSEQELKELKTKLTELLDRGFIRPSHSEYGAAVLFVPKADGGASNVSGLQRFKLDHYS